MTQVTTADIQHTIIVRRIKSIMIHPHITTGDTAFKKSRSDRLKKTGV